MHSIDATILLCLSKVETQIKDKLKVKLLVIDLSILKKSIILYNIGTFRGAVFHYVNIAYAICHSTKFITTATYWLSRIITVT